MADTGNSIFHISSCLQILGLMVVLIDFYLNYV
jgi:hypothetical protein